MFHPDYSKKFRYLYNALEIEYSKKETWNIFYPGYAYRESSFMITKKVSSNGIL